MNTHQDHQAVPSAKHTPGPALTPAMLRELRHIARYGEPCDLFEFHGANHLAFHAREKVLTALIRRGLIADAESVTDAGRAAIAKAAE